jgi:hypothetical protein
MFERRPAAMECATPTRTGKRRSRQEIIKLRRELYGAGTERPTPAARKPISEAQAAANRQWLADMKKTVARHRSASV